MLYLHRRQSPSSQLVLLLLAVLHLIIVQVAYAAAAAAASTGKTATKTTTTTTSTLPMELFEVAHSHKDVRSSEATSLHDLLVAAEHFQERTHPMVGAQRMLSGDAAKVPEEQTMTGTGRRHRKSAVSGIRGRRLDRPRHNSQQARQARHMESSDMTPTVYYAAGASSEEDLPVCAPNAVCSKIDIYDTPYIERQCRCPETTSTAPIMRQFRTPSIYQYHADRPASVQKHLENVQRNRPQRILDLNNARVPNVEEAYIKELIRKLRTVYDLPDIVLEDRERATTEARHALRKRQKVVASGNRDLDNVIHEQSTYAKAANKRMRHNSHRGDIPKIGGCSSLVGRGDGHTIVDKTRQYKLCAPVHRLPDCDNFGYTWSVRMDALTNVTQQVVHCRCKKNSVTYLTKREALPNGRGYEFLFACAPQNEIRCLRKEPCKLFSVRKRDETQDEVNTHPLCKCPREHSCPMNHKEAGVVGSTNYTKDNVMTYTAYCMADEN